MDKSKHFKSFIVFIFIIMSSMITNKGFSQKSCVVQAYFDATPLQVCTGDSVMFENRTGAYTDDILAFNWDYDGGAVNDSISNITNLSCAIGGVPPIAWDTFYKQFNAIGNYSVQLIVYKFIDLTNTYLATDTFSRTITVVDSTAWGYLSVLSNFECNTPFLVTDSSFNLFATTNFLGQETSIYWTLYDYNQNVQNSYYTQIGDTLNIQTFGSNGMIDLPIGQYWLKMETQSYCNTSIVDSINFFITGGTPEISGTSRMCIGDTATFIGESGCPDFWNWNFGDGTTQSGNDITYHVYNQLGTYQVSLQSNTGGVYGYHTIEVIQAQTPVISGYQNNCDPTVTYSIENFDPNYTYTWSTQTFIQDSNLYHSGQFIINGSSNVETANTASIDWTSATFPTLPDYALITVEAHLRGSNCSAISTYKVYDCCNGDIGKDPIYIHDTTLSYSNYFSDTHIAINGTLRIKDSLVLTSNSNLWMGPMAKIILDSNAHLILDNSGIIISNCGYMWDGVYAEGASQMISLNNSRVRGSVNGLVSNKGAAILVDSVYFEDNLYSVQLQNHKELVNQVNPPPFTPANISITNCSFNNIYTTLPNLHLFPYVNQQSNTGIMITKMDDIVIGDSIAGGNKFYKLKTGIKIFNSNVEIYNNEFKDINDITNTGLFSFVQGAIFVQNINSSGITQIFSKELVIGKSANSANQFLNCHTGVFAMNTKASVLNNTFDSCNVAIRLYEFTYNSRVDYNQISNTVEGILLHKPIGGYRNIKVRENNFPYSQVLKTGISIMNVNSSYGDIARIANNTIHFLGNQNVQHYGIITNGCNGIIVNSNNIGRAGVSIGDIANNWDKMVGIKTVQSQACEITDNFIYTMGTGILTNGSCNLTQYSCNDLTIYKYGFYLGQSSKITEQGELDVWNTHNKWSTAGVPGNQKIATDAAFSYLNWNGDVNWYYGPGYISKYIPIFIGDNSHNISPFQNTTDYHHCVATTTGTGTSTGGGSPTGEGTNSGTLAILKDKNITPEIRDYLFKDMMEGLEYIDLLNEFRAYDAKFLYNMLSEDTTLMWLGGDKDVNYQEFFDSVRMTNIGDFTKVYDFIEAEEYRKADSMNNLIIPTTEIYSNLKTVLSIYLNTWCKGEYNLSENDYNTLFEIANLTPYEGGDGVYTARIMINFNPDNHEVAFRMQQSNDNITDKNAIKLYPNPAQDNLNIEFENPTGEEITGEIKVFNISGKLIFEKQLNTFSSFYLLDISNLINGAYIFNIQINNKDNTAYRNQSGKLIVLKP